MRAFVCLGLWMTYFAYLDEFGHIGPYVARADPKYNESPVFGLAGFVMPADEVRGFGTWFYKRKCEFLASEIDRSKTHPAQWEKKGASLYTANNVKRYRELRQLTNRLLNKIKRCDGFVFYVGMRKTASLEEHNANNLYAGVFREAIKRIDQFCALDRDQRENFVLILDQHSQRPNLVKQAAQSMYASGEEGRRRLIEPVFHVESHRYQTLQAADWISGLVGRLGAFRCEPTVWPEYAPFRKYFQHRIDQVSHRSSIRKQKVGAAA